MGRGKHQAESPSPDLTTPGQRDSPVIIDWDDEEPKKPGLCCLQGCLAATSVGISFFLALPTGIILLVLANNSDNETALFAAGCVLVALPVLVLATVILLCINQNKLCCQTRNNKTSHGTSPSRTKPVVHTTMTSGQSPV
ncbi:hypothetical protein EGW08_003881 [Elysia chlorotica]|uniref:Uncharacterized protein n=1 Tax=Elysia chlorotica TaxID=188477 RepID=A0A433U3G8_ELYCH|nr:hypothetical protein EGW08_003881 [Elysia chlorotica]